MAESTAIVEYISQRHGGGRLSAKPSDPDYPHYLFWMQFNNNLQSVLFIKLAFQTLGATPGEENPMMATTQRASVERPSSTSSGTCSRPSARSARACVCA